MLRESTYYCPECDEGFVLPKARSRRDFLRTVGGTAAILAAGGLARGEDAKSANPQAEALIRELYSGLTTDQKATLVQPYDHGKTDSELPTRLRTFNSAILGAKIGEKYDSKQQELVQRIVKSILATDEAFELISRGGGWDSSGSFGGCGAAIFGNPQEKDKYAFVFSGHHLTLRCDGDSLANAAFGGPIYYGHSEDGNTKHNVYHYQTEKVQAVYDALDEKQRAAAVVSNKPAEGLAGTKPFNPRQGIAYKDLTAEQKALVEKVMRTLLAPFRQQDVDEVMQIVKVGGGMDQINLAYYADDAMKDKRDWHFWRLEGPGFVWNYRVLPHVHCFVNIASA